MSSDIFGLVTERPDRRPTGGASIVVARTWPAIFSYQYIRPHHGRAPSRPSEASRRAALTGGRDATHCSSRKWQTGATARFPLSKILASSPRFHAHFFAAFIGCVPVGVRKSDGCCNLIADLATTASLSAQRRSAHYAQSPELGEPFQHASSLHAFMLLLFCCPCGHAKVRILLR